MNTMQIDARTKIKGLADNLSTEIRGVAGDSHSLKNATLHIDSAMALVDSHFAQVKAEADARAAEAEAAKPAPAPTTARVIPPSAN